MMELDVLVSEGEDKDELLLYLADRFNVIAIPSPVQYNSALTVQFTGTPEQLASVRRWHNANRRARPDLRGKPPVGKGERR